MARKEREIVLATITRQSPRYMENDEERLCPACGLKDWLMGDTHIDETNEPVVVFTPYIFACSACDLDVESKELRELGDLAEEVVLDVSVDEFYVNWEPDEDLYRDR
ncbi:hypothetical protein ACWGNF_09800 [Streptomyces sp. NPDC055808]